MVCIQYKHLSCTHAGCSYSQVTLFTMSVYLCEGLEPLVQDQLHTLVQTVADMGQVLVYTPCYP